MGRAAITRRRALALGAAAGAGTLLARIPAPALAAARAIGFGLTVSAGDFSGGVSRVLAAPRRFDIVGLRGSRQDVEVRVRRRGGRWSRWVRLAVHGDHAPDTGSGERHYQVRYGDTLSAIAARFGTTVAALCARNGIANPNKIQAGQWLSLP